MRISILNVLIGALLAFTAVKAMEIDDLETFQFETARASISQLASRMKEDLTNRI